MIGLSDGQRLMLRAGLRKLQILEEGFIKLDSKKRPKMMVICEDTNVTPFVESFLKEEGLAEKDVLRIDSNAKGEVKEKIGCKSKNDCSISINMNHPKSSFPC